MSHIAPADVAPAFPRLQSDGSFMAQFLKGKQDLDLDHDLHDGSGPAGPTGTHPQAPHVHRGRGGLGRPEPEDDADEEQDGGHHDRHRFLAGIAEMREGITSMRAEINRVHEEFNEW